VLTLETIRRLREALLHDHLDGGLGPSTIVQLARDTGCDGLPTRDAGELAAWIRRAADRTSLELHLETFAHAVHGRQRLETLPFPGAPHARRCHWEWQDRRVHARDERRTATSAVVSLVHAVAMATVSGSPDPPTADRALRPAGAKRQVRGR